MFFAQSWKDKRRMKMWHATHRSIWFLSNCDVSHHVHDFFGSHWVRFYIYIVCFGVQALLGRCSTFIVPCIPCKGADLAPLILEAEPIDLVVIGNAANCSSWIGKAIAESTWHSIKLLRGFVKGISNMYITLNQVYKWFDYTESICFVMYDAFLLVDFSAGKFMFYHFMWYFILDVSIDRFCC